MKRFTIFAKAAALVLLAVSFPAHATACAWDPTDNYYLFYAFSGDRTNNAALRARLTEWWTHYAGKPITADDLDGLAGEQPARFARSQNAVVSAARGKNDRLMLQYLGLLCEYLSVAPSGGYDPWSYPDEEELAAQRQAIAGIAQRAARIQPGRLAPQFALLRIRALFQAERWQEVVKLYRTTASQQSESVFKDMATGFYAGALRKLGSDEEAAEIYASLGDLHSATWCVHDGRNLGTIRRLYANDPNSAALRLLVQDFVNNAQETLDNAECDGCRLGHNGYISRVYANEVEGFAALAEEAASNPLVEDPCMWLTAAAWTTFLYGNKTQGKSLIDRAIKLKGQELSHDVARVIRIVIYSGQKDDAQDFDPFVLPELQWLTTKVRYNEGNGFNLYFNAAQRIYRRHLAPRYRAQGRTTDALLCIAEAERLYSIGHEDTPDPLKVNFSGDYTSELLHEDGQTLTDLYTDLFTSGKEPLRAWLSEQLHPSLKQPDLYADLIGTRLMKEGKFSKAEPWLEKVSLKYLSAQDISYYMARRDYTQERWINKRQTLPEVRDGFGGEIPTRLSNNQKLSYCRDVLSEMKELSSAVSALAKAGAHYGLASLLFQGSLQGDCWYLTEYYRSSNPEAVLLDTLAYNLLGKAATLAKDAGNIDLQTRALTGKAFINLDAGWKSQWYQLYSYNYDWETERYTLEFHPDETKQQSRDFTALARHVRTLPANYRPAFLTQCDVLTTWMAQKP